jgi:prepilin-type processing-associated H-X9-DG protein
VKWASLLLLAACHDPVGHAGDVTPPSIDAPTPAHWVAYVGGYGGEITWYSVDRTTGAFAMLGSLQASTPSFLAFDDAFAHLYAVDESGSRVGAYAIDQATGALTAINDQPSGGNGPAHVAFADGHVLVANYGDGAVAVFPLAGDGGLMAASQTRNAGGNAHEIAVAGAWAFVPCLGSDYVAQYAWGGGALTPNAVPYFATASGAGPRHLALDGAQAYLIDEKASTIMALALDAGTGQLSEVQTLSSRASGATGRTPARRSRSSAATSTPRTAATTRSACSHATSPPAGSRRRPRCRPPARPRGTSRCPPTAACSSSRTRARTRSCRSRSIPRPASPRRWARR